MFSSLSLLCFLLQISTSRASPSIPVSTQAIVTTITAPTTSESLSTSQTVFDSTSTYENIQTITTTDSNGNSITTTTDNGPTETVVLITSNVVATIAVTNYITFVSTIGETTILGPDSTTSSNAPAAASSTGAAAASSLNSASPAPAGSTQTSTFVSMGITYAPVPSTNAASTIMSISTPTTSSDSGSSTFPTDTPSTTKTSKMSTGAKAAVGTAAVVVSIFLAILIFWLDRLRRQRKAIREQYPHGQAPGDEAGIFGFFSPIVGKPYEKDDKAEKDTPIANKDAGMNRKPSTMERELDQNDLTPPAMEVSQQPYRRPIPQRNPHSPHSPVLPVSPVRDSMLPSSQKQRDSYVHSSPNELSAEPFQKGFPRPISRFPSHHATKSSDGNLTALPELYERG